MRKQKGGLKCGDSRKIDYSKLLGFDLVSDALVDGIDFHNQNVGAKLGAKVGDKTMTVEDIVMGTCLWTPGLPAGVGLGGRRVTAADAVISSHRYSWQFFEPQLRWGHCLAGTTQQSSLAEFTRSHNSVITATACLSSFGGGQPLCRVVPRSVFLLFDEG